MGFVLLSCDAVAHFLAAAVVMFRTTCPFFLAAVVVPPTPVALHILALATPSFCYSDDDHHV